MKSLSRSLIILMGLLVVLPVHAQKNKSATISNEMFNTLEYRNVGPTRGGRVTAVEGIESIAGTFYMGATGGGVWKTDDYGITWKNVSDGFFNTPSIGAISVVQSDPNVVYVGTGSDGIRSNVITGKGVYKSTDAGKTWQHIGLKETGQIGAVEIHPNDPNIIFVSAIGQAFQPNEERGVYRSKDAGATWKKVLYHSDTIGSVDLEFAPGDPQTIYASMWRAERKPWTIISGGHQAGGIYKSVDGGDTWKKVTKGLPEGLIGKIDLTVSPADPNRLYALVEAPKDVRGLYRSNDKGESFEHITNKKELTDRPFYYCNIYANPKNANSLYINSTQFWHSTDAGKTWKRIRTPHGDNHDIWMNPSDTLLYVQANDGGANVTTNSGKTWSTQRNQPTAELYQIEVDDQFPYWIYAGQQDNSTITVPSVPPYNAAGGHTSYWTAIGGCETGPAVPKPGNPDIIYSNCKGRFGVFNRKTGQEMQYYVGASNMYGHNPKDLKFRFQRVSPIHVSPHNPDVVYHTSQFVHKTTNDGQTWETISPDLTAFTPETQVISGGPITRDITGEEFYSTIYAIRESPVKEGTIWVGANDGPVHVTTDGGKNWKNVTPSTLPAGGRIDCVEPSPHNANKAYFTSLRYQLGDWKPYIYKTEDNGGNWELINNGIPSDYPVRVVREDPTVEGILYAGTEFGMYISFDDGKNWQEFQQNLPVTPITDIKVHRQDLILSTMGRSFWILDNVNALHSMANAQSSKQAYMFKPKDSFRYRYRGNGKNSVPHYPSAGVTMDYYLAKDAENLKVEILDASGAVVRTYLGIDKKKGDKKGGETVSMATGFVSQAPKPSLKKTAGMHRMRWDLRHRGPWDSNENRRFQNGPMANPGAYTVKLTVDKKEFTQSFQLLKDPRTNHISSATLNEQMELALKIRDLQDLGRRLSDKIKTRRKELAKTMNDGTANDTDKAEDQKLEEFERMLETSDGIYQTPMLLAQMNYLSSMLNRADQQPGKDAVDRYAELKAKFEEVESAYQQYAGQGGNAGDR